MDNIEKKLQERILELERENELLKKDPIKRGYFALCRIQNLQVDLLNDFDLKSRISDNKKETLEYERVESIWTKLPTMITNLNLLKTELKISKSDEDNEYRTRNTTPESIANVLGNIAGKKD